MSQSAITRVDSMGILRTKASIRDTDVDERGPVGPTPTYVHLGNELDRLAAIWGTRDRGWVARCNGATWVVSAYLGKPSCVVAVTTDRDLRVALARLLGSLYLVDGT